MELPCIVENLRCFNNGFSLISANLNAYSGKYSSEMEEIVAPHVNEKYNTFTVVANLPEDINGMKGGQYIFVGEFSRHPKYGSQFKSDFYYQDLPATEDGLKAFLTTLPNIKEHRSQAIINRFGVEGTLDLLDNNIYLLTEINGITAQRIPAIEAAWNEKKWMRQLYQFICDKGLPSNIAKPIYKMWGNAAKDILEKNPYRLVELRGIGFETADNFAHKILEKIPDDFRTTACISYLLSENLHKDSNLCCPYLVLRPRVIDTIRKCDSSLGKHTNEKKYTELVASCLKSNLDVFTVVKDIESNVSYVYLSEIWEKELYIGKSICSRSKLKSLYVCGEDDIAFAEKDISDFMGKKITLDDTQKEAIKTSFNNKISIITGAGGTGKSMICRCLFKLAQRKGLSIKMMSPTGKAAQVLESKTGASATTIHRGLKMVPGEEMSKEEITEDILLIDEISMCGIDTIYAIMVALESNSRANIVLVGDKNQLPSVSPGNFLSDILKSGCANVIKLNKIHRQSENSYISLLANEISQGKVVSIPEEAIDIKWKNLSGGQFNNYILSFIDKYCKDGNNFDDLQFISPMKKGLCGVFGLNELIQRKMADINGETDRFFQRNFLKLHVGDRVIQLENNYEKNVFNGDMGSVMEFGEDVKDPLKSDEKEKFVLVKFYNQEIVYWGDEIDQLLLAWCITVHKFQGSQADNIVFIMSREANMMMSKELVYTAFTRAAKQLDIFGDADMLRLAPAKSIVRKRYTNLPKIIQSYKTKTKLFKTLS